MRFGEISPFQVWHRVEAAKANGNAVVLKNAIKFMAEVGWREFSYHLLYHWPDLATVNFDSRFDAFPWGEADSEALAAWQQGRTGIPLVDAGMREQRRELAVGCRQWGGCGTVFSSLQPRSAGR